MYWWEVFPHGTPEGDEENRFFDVITRHKEYRWRSVDKIASAANLSKLRVEEIISKYVLLDIIRQNPDNPDQWGYWERVGVKEDEKDILDEDQDNRVDKHKT